MKSVRSWKALSALALLTLLVAVPLVYAQLGVPGAPVQQIPSRLDAANQTTTSATSAATLTLTPNGSESVYVYGWDVSNCAGATAVTAAAVTTITTTNLVGSPVLTLGSGTTAGACAQQMNQAFPTGLKSQTPGTAVTFVLPTFATNQTVRMNVYWRSAP